MFGAFHIQHFFTSEKVFVDFYKLNHSFYFNRAHAISTRYTSFSFSMNGILLSKETNRYLPMKSHSPV